MNTEKKAIRAIEKSGIDFSYNLECNDAGHVKKIVNLDARNPVLGKHSNDQRMKMDVDSSMSISEMVDGIVKKWGK